MGGQGDPPCLVYWCVFKKPDSVALDHQRQETGMLERTRWNLCCWVVVVFLKKEMGLQNQVGRRWRGSGPSMAPKENPGLFRPAFLQGWCDHDTPEQPHPVAHPGWRAWLRGVGALLFSQRGWWEPVASPCTTPALWG